MTRSLLTFVAFFLLLACGSPDPSVAEHDPSPIVTPMARPALQVLLIAGQSNALGVDNKEAPAGLPDASILLWRSDYHYNDGTHSFGTLDVSPRNGSFSHEIQLAKRLKAAGHDVAVIKIVQGGTYITRWIPTAKAPGAGSKFYGEIAEALTELRALYPETVLHLVWVWDQGEEEARYFDLPTVEAWSGHFLDIQSAIEVAAGEPVDPFVVRTGSTIAGKTFPGALETQQAAVVSASHLIDSNDSDLMPDRVHRKGHAQNTIGDRIADVLLNEETP